MDVNNVTDQGGWFKATWVRDYDSCLPCVISFCLMQLIPPSS